ncbi:MAG: MBL fold metallo-hydrolase [Cyanobacteria bacterium P01_D01_bin.123]
MPYVFRSRAIVIALGSLIGLAAGAVAQDRDFSNVTIETIPVSDSVSMLVGDGGNIGVSAGEDGIFLIDDQFAPLTQKILTAIEGISDRPIRFLINTHWHFDHTGGNENLGEMGAVIVAHDKARERMSVDNFIQAFNAEVPATPDSGLPAVTFADSVTFHLNGDTIRAFHVATAHTDGDTVIHFEDANVIHTGDIYFNGFYPFIDTGSEGSIAGMVAAVEEILAIADAETNIIPGHGPLSNRAELESYRDMLVTVRDRTEAAIASGTSLDDFLATSPLADLEDDWGGGFLKTDQFLGIVFADLSR